MIAGIKIAIKWLEAHVKENNRQEAPTKDQLEELDCLKDWDIFETACKISNIPVDQKTTDATIQGQHDCLVVRVCQKACIETQECVQLVSDGHRIGSFQASFRKTSESSKNRSGKNIENNWF